MELEAKLYLIDDKSIYQIAEIIGISPTGVWKRLKKQGVVMDASKKAKGKHWAVEKRGTEYLGGDGRYWVRGIPSSESKNSTRRAVVVMEQKLGHPIPRGYHVHHKDENITNDDPSNLELKLGGKHSRDHCLGVKNPKKGAKNIGKTKLNKDEMSEVVIMYKTGKYSQQSIADKFGIHQTLVSKIVRSSY